MWCDYNYWCKGTEVGSEAQNVGSTSLILDYSFFSPEKWVITSVHMHKNGGKGSSALFVPFRQGHMQTA